METPHTYAYVYVCMNVCMYVCIYIYICVLIIVLILIKLFHVFYLLIYVHTHTCSKLSLRIVKRSVSYVPKTTHSPDKIGWGVRRKPHARSD